jgi:hypothetical protein
MHEMSDVALYATFEERQTLRRVVQHTRLVTHEIVKSVYSASQAVE